MLFAQLGNSSNKDEEDYAAKERETKLRSSVEQNSISVPDRIHQEIGTDDQGIATLTKSHENVAYNADENNAKSNKATTAGDKKESSNEEQYVESPEKTSKEEADDVGEERSTLLPASASTSK